MHSENDRELSYQLSNINRLYMSPSPQFLSLSLPQRALFLGGGGRVRAHCVQNALSAFFDRVMKPNKRNCFLLKKISWQTIQISTDECIQRRARNRNACGKKVIGCGFTSQWLAEKVACVAAGLVTRDPDRYTCMQVKIKCLQEEGDTKQVNKPSESNGHTTQLSGMANLDPRASATFVQWMGSPSRLWYGQYLTHAHSHIIPAVEAAGAGYERKFSNTPPPPPSKK